MGITSLLLEGFSVALTPMNLAWLLAGSILGTLFGMIPGFGPSTGIALLLPLCLGLRPETAMIAMAAIYYGAMFGGSRSSILMNVPGDSASVASCFDGYPMARNGQAEVALAVSAVASLMGGLFASVAFALLALPAARIALRFGPPETFCLMVFSLAATAAVSRENLLKGLISLVLGLMISTVGLDSPSGVSRFTFGLEQLQTGIPFVVVILGIYGFSEVLINLETLTLERARPLQLKTRWIRISLVHWKRSLGPILRQSPVGFLIGILPGAGAGIAALRAYRNEKRRSPYPEEFGKGAVEGLAAPEAANNACSIGAMLPMMTLGVPGSGTAAVMLGGLLLCGQQPGPLLFEPQPGIGWAVIASLFLGNLACAVINFPLAGFLVRLLSIPPKTFYPLVVVFSFLGLYTVNFSVTDLYLLAGMGFCGYLMKKFRVPTGPLVLASVIGDSVESSFRQSLALSGGSPSIFFRSSISSGLLFAAALALAWPLVLDAWARRKEDKPAERPGE